MTFTLSPILVCAAFSILLSLEVLIIAAAASHHIPFHNSPFIQILFQRHVERSIHPERETLLYGIFVAVCLSLGLAMALIGRRQAANPWFHERLKQLTLVQLFWVCVEVFAAFKLYMDKGPDWAGQFFYGALGASILSKIFWPEISAFIPKIKKPIQLLRNFMPKKDLDLTGAVIPAFILIWAVQLCLVLRFFWHPTPHVLYACFLGSVALATASCVFIFKRRERRDLFLKNYGALLAVEAVLTFMWFSCLWQIIMYSARPWMAQFFYCVLMALSIAIKICWPELKIWCSQCAVFFAKIARQPWASKVWNILAVVFIFLVIYIPDPEAVVAWFYMGEQFHNWDGQFMGTTYGFFRGLLPDVDVISIYGFGLPVIMAGLMKLFGGFSYANAVKGFFLIGIAYYILWYLLLRKWFKGSLMAFAAIIVGMRAQMFDQIVAPMTWVQPSASIFRYCFDVLFFMALYGHVCTQRRSFIMLAAFIAGIGMYHMMSTGLLLELVLVFYLGVHVIMPQLRPYVFRSARDIVFIAAAVLVAPIVMFLWVWLTVHGHVWTREFWINVTEYNSLFYNNIMTMPLTEGLDRKDYLFVAVGLLYPVLYLASALYAGMTLFLRKIEDQGLIFAMFIGLYGCFLHSYYILVSSKYFAVGLPGIFLAMFWIDRGARQLSLVWQRRVRLTAVAAALYILLTSHMFMAYPNLINVSRNPIVDPLVARRVGNDSYYFHQLYVDFPDWFKLPVNSLGQVEEGLKFEKDFKTHRDLVDFYHQDTDFTQDANLIRRLTPAQARVPLLCSFDVLFLQQSDRLPFFYYYPLLNSRPMRMRTFMITSMFTYTQLSKTIAQLEQQKPLYIFMERIFLTPSVPAAYGYEYEELISLLRYILKNYEPAEAGQYLVAMKRKEGI